MVVSVTVWPLDSITALLLLIIQRIRKISHLQQDSGLSVLSTDLWCLIDGGAAPACLFTVYNFANGIAAAQVLFLCKPLSVGDICADRIISFFLSFLPYNGAFNESWALIGSSGGSLPLSLGEMPDKSYRRNIRADRIHVFQL